MKSRNKGGSKTGSSYASQANIGSPGSSVVPAPVMSLSHEHIAERAKSLWMASGCLPGRDEQNWHEAEAQLRAELKSR